MRLGMTRVERGGMIISGAVEAMPIQFGCVLSTREVESPESL